MDDMMDEDEQRTPSLPAGGEDDAEEEPEAAGTGGADDEEGAGGGGAGASGGGGGDDAEAEEVEQEQRKVSSSSKKRPATGGSSSKRPKKRNNNVWGKSSSRKSSKKSAAKSGNGNNGGNGHAGNDGGGGADGGAGGGAGRSEAAQPDSVYLNPIVAKVEDGPELPVMLSRVNKAEKVELSGDRMTAGSSKGYRMVKATRGVVEGAWYFEIKVEQLGDSGHTRLGWCTHKGDVQAPVGYDVHGYAYRDVDGGKVHAAWREAYAQPYKEGDTIGFYINLPNGAALAPKPPEVVTFKGGTYTAEAREEAPKPLPGSQVAFFKNGEFQGVAFKDIYAGRYYPAASMYTLPNKPQCKVRFNFGPDFECPPSDWAELPEPQPISAAPFFLDGAAAAASAAAAAAAAAASAAAEGPESKPSTEMVEDRPKVDAKAAKRNGDGSMAPSSSGSIKDSSGAIEVAIENMTDVLVVAQT